MICYRRDFACFLFVPMRFPIVQYADTLLLIHVDGQQILAFLIIFSQSTGLDINYLKSSMIPINVVTEEASTLANIFGCPFNKLPFTYLGLLVVTTRPRIVDLLPLADCIGRRLTASSCFLAQDGMLKLLNYVISFMPLFFVQLAYSTWNFEAV